MRRGWFTIAPGRPFIRDLVHGLERLLGTEGLHEALILVPTRRGARTLIDAFSQMAVQSSKKALILPQIRAIGDLEEGEPPFRMDHLNIDLPPPSTPLQRRICLTNLLKERYRFQSKINNPLSTREAFSLSEPLGHLFESLALEEVAESLDRLEGLLANHGDLAHRVDNLAQHYQDGLAFLDIALSHWPKKLESLGLMDPAIRQVSLINRLELQYSQNPPRTPLILAGSTGSAPSMARLMGTIAGLDYGMVILPGLDLSLDDQVFSMIGPSHPQFTLKKTLDRALVTRDEVKPWPSLSAQTPSERARAYLVQEALRPAEATKDWVKQVAKLIDQFGSEDTLFSGLEGLHHIECEHDDEAANIIALLMLEGLEKSAGNTALITPDPLLARRVSAVLSRYGLAADSSAGLGLGATTLGRFLLDGLRLYCDAFDGFGLSAFLKNPLHRANDHEGLWTFETKVLRGFPLWQFEDYHKGLVGYKEATQIYDILDLEALHAPKGEGFKDHLIAFIQWIESQGPTEVGGLWKGAAGEEASVLLSQWLSLSEDLIIEDRRSFGDIIHAQIIQARLRTGGNTHPRLKILGTIEARLLDADRVIMAGLEEGVWPQIIMPDPFLSLSMRESLGLPSTERKIGLSAHDFVQAATRPEVFMVSRQRVENAPMLESRFLWRLKTLIRARPDQNLKGRDDIKELAKTLSMTLSTTNGVVDASFCEDLKPATRPEPRPPLLARPLSMSITDAESLFRDPYSFYVKRALKLKKLNRIAEPVMAAELGTVIHSALEAFIKSGPPLGQHGRQVLYDVLMEKLSALRFDSGLVGLKRPLMQSLADHFVKFEEDLRGGEPFSSYVEQQGKIEIELDRGSFVITGTFDRIDCFDDKSLIVRDYKTGAIPKVKDVDSGRSPQLSLTAAMALKGAFPTLNDTSYRIKQLSYVRVASKEVKNENRNPKNQELDEFVEKIWELICNRIKEFEDSDKAYLPWAIKNPYAFTDEIDHLARRFEWSVESDVADIDEGEGTSS